MNSGDYQKIMKKAGSFLARRACSRGELRNKLLKSAPAPQVDLVLDRLQQLNLLNDTDYAYNFALCRMGREGWSTAKVRDSLLRREVPQETVESALKRVCSEVDLPSLLAEYARKRLKKSKAAIGPKEVRSLILHLHGRGFDGESIRAALSRIAPAALLRRLETGE